jgi:hypothetical protein
VAGSRKIEPATEAEFCCIGCTFGPRFDNVSVRSEPREARACG